MSYPAHTQDPGYLAAVHEEARSHDDVIESAEPAAQQIAIASRQPGYAHVRLSGTCSPDITVEDIQRRFYHSYFGGRDAWVRDGRWGCVVHTD